MHICVADHGRIAACAGGTVATGAAELDDEGGPLLLSSREAPELRQNGGVGETQEVRYLVRLCLAVGQILQDCQPGRIHQGPEQDRFRAGGASKARCAQRCTDCE